MKHLKLFEDFNNDTKEVETIKNGDFTLKCIHPSNPPCM